MSEPVETPEATATATPSLSPKSSAFVSHLLSYPVVGATVSYTASLPLVQRASATAKPYVSKYVEPAVARASPVLARVDMLGDSTLSTVDKYVPAFKSTQAPDIPAQVQKSVESVKSTTHLYSEAAKSKVNDTVVEPTKQAVDKAKQRTASFYDAKGRPFVRAKLDPVLAPINTRLVALVDAYLPAAKADTDGATAAAASTTASSGAPSTELSRLYYIGANAVYRVKPIVESRVASTKAHAEENAAYVLSIPQAAKSRALAVWEDKKSKTDIKSKPLTGRLYVSLSTGKQLLFEVIGLAEGFAHEQFDHAKSLAKVPLGIVHEHSNGKTVTEVVQENVPESVEGVVAESH
ncbi:hypothetical protein BZA70DRAFT_285019 [Myxozyma melibiosi]|uniref:Uncharacterized protein n=1 Tax=Myxozyma melibiosi TaxID=54550 RepID=A0ABR1F0W6_9ASCO